MTDKLLNDLFSRERLWAGLTLPSLSATQNSHSCANPPFRYNDQFYNMRSGLLGNQEFRYHSLNHEREGRGQLVEQLDVYSEPKPRQAVEGRVPKLPEPQRAVRVTLPEQEMEQEFTKSPPGSVSVRDVDQPNLELGGGSQSDDLLEALAFEKARLARLNTMYGGMNY